MPRHTLALVVPLALMMLAPPQARAEAPADEEDSFATGLEFEPETVYRSFPAVGTYRAFLPPTADLSAFLLPPRSQGAQSSCVAWATSYGLRGYYENRRRGGTTTPAAFSPAFVYNQIKNHAADCEVGTSISDALNLLKRVGTVPWSRFPYDPKDCSRLPDPNLAEDARPYRISDWQRVNYNRIDDVKGQIYAGNPVVVGMMVNKAFHRLHGDAVFEDPTSDGSGHAMVVVGYDDTRQAFRLFNSWGDKWGEHGLGWIDYETFKARTHGAYVMQVQDGAPPAPAPHPAPAPAPAPAPIPAPVPAPAPTPTTSGDDLSRIKALLADVPCSTLSVRRSGDDRLVVQGVIGDAADRDQLARRLGQEGGRAASLDVSILPWPQCEAHGTFAPALAHPDGLSLQVRQGSSGRPVLQAGDSLMLEVTTPTFYSYLYVVYLQAGGDAVFLYTPATNNGHPLQPGLHLTIGDGNAGQARLMVAPPFGDEMILAIAAPTALTATELPETMTEREFLSLFRTALLGRGARAVTRATHDTMAAAAYTLLTTRP